VVCHGITHKHDQIYKVKYRRMIRLVRPNKEESVFVFVFFFLFVYFFNKFFYLLLNFIYLFTTLVAVYRLLAVQHRG